jgi:sigma-B regulation protein RsbU (phosphoserine phosphatase)
VRSASPEEWRGGDVFETLTRRDGSISILLADVSSKSSTAVLHSEMLRSAFNRSANTQRHPGRILSSLNALPFDTASPGACVTFASAFVATFDEELRSMTYASAGHDQAMIIGERSHRHLAVTGPLLGVFVEPAFTERREPFGADELLVLVTDGVTECRHVGAKALRFGTGGIVRALASARIDGSRSACEAIVANVDEFSGRYYRDDATIAVVGTR